MISTRDLGMGLPNRPSRAAGDVGYWRPPSDINRTKQNKIRIGKKGKSVTCGDIYQRHVVHGSAAESNSSLPASSPGRSPKRPRRR